MSDTPEEKMATEPISDDIVMAYADGALPPEDRLAVADALAREPALMLRFASFLFTRGPLARAFDPVLAAPIPERLLRTARESGPTRTRATGASLGSAGLSRLADLFRMPGFSPAVALPTVLVGLTAGWLAHDALRTDFVALDDRGLVASASLQRAFDLTPSGRSASLPAGLSVEPKFTFASVTKAWCRQYELAYRGGQRSGGLACRGEDGLWRVVTQTQAAPRSAPSGKTVPAGQGDDVLDGIRAQLKDGDVLGPEQEQRLIEERWQTKS